jgi:hypothetical protein
MRAIVGALLILAASVCFLAGTIARNQEVSGTRAGTGTAACVAAAMLLSVGLIFLSRGFAEEHERAREKDRWRIKRDQADHFSPLRFPSDEAVDVRYQVDRRFGPQ